MLWLLQFSINQLLYVHMSLFYRSGSSESPVLEIILSNIYVEMH